jgi:alkanesulfonate monooxygenase SsuD/methylene tetrahydromethanopterin reductase-like flavin-dependent oxidoreductase (luciferase family)
MRARLSILDLAPIARGQTPSDSFAASVALAQRAEELGYHRVWYAEHHNMPSIASSATSVLIAHIGAQTSAIRLGADGIMLPNHSPLTIAEQFGTLEAMLADASRVPGVDAIPGKGSKVPLYILGSSLFGAQLAGMYGLPYAFASHFAPDALEHAIAAYRSEFKPSAQLEAPYVIAGVNVTAADTTEAARSQFQAVRRARAASLFARRVGLNPAEITDEQADELLAGGAAVHVDQMLLYSAVGTPGEVSDYLDGFLRKTGADELIVVHQARGIEDRLRSVTLLAEAMRESVCPR